MDRLPRSKCPRERSAKGQVCERDGCDHSCAKGTAGYGRSHLHPARVCACCIVQLGQEHLTKFQLMRRLAERADFEEMQTIWLTELAAMPPRRPLGWNVRRRPSPTKRVFP